MWDKFKILRHKDIIRSIVVDDEIPIPFHVEIELTEICNHRCVFCHWHNHKRKNTLNNFTFKGHRSLPLDRLIKFISELETMGTRAISFTGVGDPLMYENMEQVLSKLSASTMEFGITSNFNMPLSDILIEQITKAKWFRCSIDASSNEIYAKVHNPNGQNMFQNTVNNLMKLLSKKNRGPVNLSFVICEHNKREIYKTALFAKDLGVDSISYRPDTGFSRLNENRRYENEIIEQLNNAEKLNTDGFKVYSNYARLAENNKIDYDSYCYYSNHALYLAANGDVYPCCMTRYDKRYSYGNILGGNFKEFWDDVVIRNNYKSINMRHCPPCRHTEDNEVLHYLYNDEGNSDNFI